MPKVSSRDIEQLKVFIQDGFTEVKQDINRLDDKVERIQTEVKQLDNKVDRIENKIEGLDKRLKDIELNQAETKGRMEEWKTAIQKIPDLSEKFGELKNWRQIAFIIIAAVVGWFARSGRL